jgi:hypothetical protein
MRGGRWAHQSCCGRGCALTAWPAKLVSVTAWAELAPRGGAKLPGCLRVLVDGQSAGGAERVGGEWRACFYLAPTRAGTLRDRISVHATAEDAVKAVIRSGWARRLGARASSRVYWSAKADKLAGRTGGAW